MGVQGSYQYLEAHGVVGLPVDTTLPAHIHVDVLSIYFAYLVATMKIPASQVSQQQPR